MIRHNTIVHNHSAMYGGGIRIYSGSSPTVKDNYIAFNRADYDGGGVESNTDNPHAVRLARHRGDLGYRTAIIPTSPKIIHNTIVHNFSTRGGGLAMNNYNGQYPAQPLIEKNRISHNIASSEGGAIYVEGGATINENLILNNSMSSRKTYGAGIFVKDGGCKIEDNVILHNVNAKWGGESTYAMPGA